MTLSSADGSKLILKALPLSETSRVCFHSISTDTMVDALDGARSQYLGRLRFCLIS